MQKLLTKKPKVIRVDQQQQENPENQEQKNLSPNLLLPVDTEEFAVKYSPKVVKMTFSTIVFLSSLFVLLLLVNYTFDKKLNALREERDSLVLRIDFNSETATKVKGVADMISTYKAVKADVVPISDGFEYVVGNFQELVRVQQISYRRDVGVYTVNSRADTPVQYAYLIAELLKGDDVDSITIKNVELRPGGGKREYLAILEVKMK